MIRPVWYQDGALHLIDQRALPNEETYLEIRNLEEAAVAIETMVVRGAPAIGIAAAFALCVARREGVAKRVAVARLERTRPTAVNLFWALRRMSSIDWTELEALETEAVAIRDEDAQSCRRIGALGVDLIPDGARVLTHCNAGALATAEYGTALAPIRAAHAAGKKVRVFASETRPRLQGAKLTSWELSRDGIDVTVIPDTAVAHLVGRGEVDLAFVGADRIARSGDVANKIGTRGLACILRMHDRPLYVAAPWSTVDLRTSAGSDIPIEERAPEEVTHVGGCQLVPDGVQVRNPAFDITPADWVSDLITERGRTGEDLEAGIREMADIS